MTTPACPAPPCPVASPADLAGAPDIVLPAGQPWARCDDGTWGYDEPNPGVGDTRFAPFADGRGRPVPTMYVAANDVGALLETVFHDVDTTYGVIYRAAGRPVAPSLVAVIFTGRVGVSRGGWPRTGLQTVSLGSGQGRTRVDVIAELLNIDIVTG